MDKYDLIRENRAFDLLRRDAESGALSHAYMLCSPDLVTLEGLSYLFLAECIYGSATAENARRAETTGADVIRLPHGDKVLVSDVQELTDTLYYTPTELTRRFYIISRAETMGDPAQNKLLKALEEPPSSVVIILLAARPSAMLPTIRSRVREVDVRPTDEGRLRDYLTLKFGPGKRTDLAPALSGGLIGRAEEIAAGGEAFDVYNLALEAFLSMKNSHDVPPYSARLAEYKDRMSDFIDFAERIMGDCLLVSAGRADDIRLAASREEIQRLTADYTAEVAVKLRPAFMRARKRLELNGNVQSVTDELLFAFLEVKAKCRK